MSASLLGLSLVNAYLAHKQHLSPSAPGGDIVQVTRDIVALHATAATGPYLSLWARIPGFEQRALEEALYERRDLVRVLCMRMTMHVVPADHLPCFHQAYVERYAPAERQNSCSLLVRAGLCEPGQAPSCLDRLHRRVLDVLAREGPSTVRTLAQRVPELQSKVQHSAGKAYAGEFSLGSRLVPGMCALGMLVRARPRGTWRSSLHEYALLSDWLPGVNLASVSPQEARAWLVRRYLAAFGPATAEDVQWWTGFAKGETEEALQAVAPSRIAVEGMDGDCWMLAEDVRQLDALGPEGTPWAAFLPALDPYIMGYRDRRRFLSTEHRAKVFDRAGNAMPTVWVDGRVVGAWGQRKNGSITYGLFEPVSEERRSLLEARRRELDGFLQGEPLGMRTHTPFVRDLQR